MRPAMISLLLLGGLAPARAASTVLPAGGTLELKGDIVLTGEEELIAAGTASRPCTIVGNGFQVKTDGEWTGRLKLTHCTLKGLGQAATVQRGRTGKLNHAFDLRAGGEAEIVMEHCTFDGSSTVGIVNNGNSRTVFRNNTVLANSLARADKAAHLCSGFFTATGSSRARKYFQGNRIYKTGVYISRATNWVIGGDSDEEGNIIIGLRACILANGEQTVIRRNYVHVLMPVDPVKYPYWSQVTGVSPWGETSENVIRAGHWVVQNVRGNFHHNLVTEVHGHDWLRIGRARIHHNIFAHIEPGPARWGDKGPYGGSSGIYVCYPTDRLEVFNNVFDGHGGVGRGLDAEPGATFPSVRNNVFYRFTRGIGPNWRQRKPVVPPPARLGYADYNCFYNPGGACDNYAFGVAGKTERKDAGFARSDLPAGGQIDAHVDPKFKGPLPEKFPFSDQDVKSRKVTVSQILKFYRDAYTPAQGSPLLRAGDPGDGEGTDIGAVQVSPVKAATAPPADTGAD